MKNDTFSKSFTIIVFVLSLSILIRFEYSWSIFISYYNKDSSKYVLDCPILAKLDDKTNEIELLPFF